MTINSNTNALICKHICTDGIKGISHVNLGWHASPLSGKVTQQCFCTAEWIPLLMPNKQITHWTLSFLSTFHKLTNSAQPGYCFLSLSLVS